MSETNNTGKVQEAESIVEFQCNSPLLNEILKLEVIENQLFRANHLSKSRSTGIYGGQIICQAIASANQTLSKDFILHSVHCYFILSGDNKKPVVYHVENVRDGRSFATRLVKAVQGSRHIFSCIFSYQKYEECLHSYQISMPNVPHPDSLQLFEEVLRDMMSSDKVTEHQRMFITNYVSQEFLFYIKPVGKNWLNFFLDDDSEKSERLLYWIRLRTAIDPQRQDIHRCLAGYISDLFMVQTATLKLPKRFYPSMTVSLDHSIWFHDNFHVDDWMLFESHSDRYAGSRALISGRIWKSDGTLAVSVMQEGLLRIKSLL